MATIKKELEFSKEADELAQGLVSFVKHVKQALADGWQPGQDLPVLLTATMADLVPAIQGVDLLPAEEKENAKAFYRAFGEGGLDMVYVFKN